MNKYINLDKNNYFKVFTLIAICLICTICIPLMIFSYANGEYDKNELIDINSVPNGDELCFTAGESATKVKFIAEGSAPAKVIYTSINGNE